MCSRPLWGTMFEQKSVPQGAVQQEGEGVQISLSASGWLELAVSRTNSSSSLVGVMCSQPQFRDLLNTWHPGDSGSGVRA